VLPTAGPGWLTRVLVATALGTGAALTAAGIRRLRAAVPAASLPATADPQPTAGLSSSA
jgi:hypothetical protein